MRPRAMKADIDDDEDHRKNLSAECEISYI